MAVRARECGCPPWVECIHFDGRVTWLADSAVYEAAICSGHRDFYPGEAYSVSTGLVAPCLTGGEPVLSSDLPWFYTTDAAAARAEFRRREAELLGREA